ncbi:MAG: hypothetical protein FK734_18565 [Asgard group archaeon]|nr:hypothetical protein [Asgard group archaeon]
MKTKKIESLVFLIIFIFPLTGIIYGSGIYIEPPIYDEYIRVSGFVKNLEGSPIEGAWVELIDQYGRVIGSFEFTSSTGYYSVTARAARQDITVRASAEDQNASVIRRAPGTYTVNFYLDVQNEPIENRMAFFFYNSIDASEQYIDSYAAILQDKGFNTVTKKDFEVISDNWKDVLAEIDDMENENDFIFLYFCGHGSYQEDIDDSSFTLDDSILSSELNIEISKFESQHIFIIVEACSSGGFSDLFGANRFVITSTDNYHLSQRMLVEGIGYFTDYFFTAIDLGYTENGAFNYASNCLLDEFENEYQYPQMNDQDPYQWFD